MSIPINFYSTAFKNQWQLTDDEMISCVKDNPPKLNYDGVSLEKYSAIYKINSFVERKD